MPTRRAKPSPAETRELIADLKLLKRLIDSETHLAANIDVRRAKCLKRMELAGLEAVPIGKRRRAVRYAPTEREYDVPRFCEQLLILLSDRSISEDQYGAACGAVVQVVDREKAAKALGEKRFHELATRSTPGPDRLRFVTSKRKG
jgi:hypothetical protein